MTPSRSLFRYSAALVVAALCSACSNAGTTISPAVATAPVAAVPEAPPPPPPPPAPTSVRYRVVFDGLWSQQTHPQDYPGNPHFSPLIGGTHTAAVRFWADGGIASDGIKRMAEQGFTSPLDAHINDAIAAGTARDLIRGDGIRLSPASTAVEFDVHQSHPLLTLVSMVAPSPDWFVGTEGLPLFVNGQWVDALVLELRPWDAGTDGGRSYESGRAIESPPCHRPAHGLPGGYRRRRRAHGARHHHAFVTGGGSLLSNVMRNGAPPGTCAARP